MLIVLVETFQQIAQPKLAPVLQDPGEPAALARRGAHGRRHVRARAQQARHGVHAARHRHVLRDRGGVFDRDGRDVLSDGSRPAGHGALVARPVDRRGRRDHSQPADLDARDRARRGDDVARRVRDQLPALRLHAAAVGHAGRVAGHQLSARRPRVSHRPADLRHDARRAIGDRARELPARRADRREAAWARSGGRRTGCSRARPPSS